MARDPRDGRGLVSSDAAGTEAVSKTRPAGDNGVNAGDDGDDGAAPGERA
jgi:hypothetical protein